MPDSDPPPGDLYERGMRLRRQVLGDAHVDRALARAAEDPFLQPVQDLATTFGWGAVWARPGLERKVRSFLSITCLAAMGKHDELRSHLRGAVHNGATREEIREVILHAGVYCGVPVALECTRIAKEVLDEMGA
jgi:4-carboxymuconolactone decarboxylase